MKRKYFIYSKGPQFLGGNSAYLFIVIVFLIVFAIMEFRSQDYYTSLGLFALVSFLLVFLLDYKGIEIDKRDNRVREYSIRPWGKMGKWKNLGEYRSIRLKYERYKLDRVDLDEDFDDGSAEELYGAFIVYFAGDEHADEIVLGEFPKYSEAKSFAYDVEHGLDQEFVDEFAIRLAHARKTRRR